MAIVLVMTTAPNQKTAKRLSRLLVQKKLAACVTVLDKASSFYRWKGKIEQSKELLLLIKTEKKNYLKIERFIRSEHPYELPEIIGVPVRVGFKKYLDWVSESLKD
jgi:periplasmic divalent cation tolerance protein